MRRRPKVVLHEGLDGHAAQPKCIHPRRQRGDRGDACNREPVDQGSALCGGKERPGDDEACAAQPDQGPGRDLKSPRSPIEAGGHRIRMDPELCAEGTVVDELTADFKDPRPDATDLWCVARFDRWHGERFEGRCDDWRLGRRSPWGWCGSVVLGERSNGRGRPQRQEQSTQDTTGPHRHRERRSVRANRRSCRPRRGTGGEVVERDGLVEVGEATRESLAEQGQHRLHVARDRGLARVEVDPPRAAGDRMVLRAGPADRQRARHDRERGEASTPGRRVLCRTLVWDCPRRAACWQSPLLAHRQLVPQAGSSRAWNSTAHESRPSERFLRPPD